MRIFPGDQINTGNFIACLGTLGTSFILLSCTTIVPVSHPSNTPVSEQEKVKIRSEIKWSPRQIPSEEYYFIKDSTKIISSSEDSSSTRSFETTHIYTVSTTRIDDSLLALTTTVHSATASDDSLIPFKPNSDSKIIPQSKAVISTTGRFISLSREASSICPQGITPVEARVYELIISFPAKPLELGDQWSDTVTTTVCRNRILLREQKIRQYKVVQYSTWNHLPTIQIALLTTSIVTTDTSQSRGVLITKGFGKSSTTLHVDRVTGILLHSDASSQMELTITTARGIFPFTQTVTSHILVR